MRLAMYAESTGDCMALLLTLSHADFEADINVNTSGADITSNGVTYTAYPFDIILPNDEADRSPRAKLTIDNTDRRIVAAVRSLRSAPSATFSLVRASALDVLEVTFPDFKLTNISYDMATVEGDLTLEEFTAEPYPGLLFTPSTFPGLF